MRSPGKRSKHIKLDERNHREAVYPTRVRAMA